MNPCLALEDDLVIGQIRISEGIKDPLKVQRGHKIRCATIHMSRMGGPMDHLIQTWTTETRVDVQRNTQHLLGWFEKRDAKSLKIGDLTRIWYIVNSPPQSCIREGEPIQGERRAEIHKYPKSRGMVCLGGSRSK